MKGKLISALMLIAGGLNPIPTDCGNAIMVSISYNPNGAPKDPKPGLTHNRSARAAAGGRQFKGRAKGQLASRLTLTHYAKLSKTNTFRYAGTFKSSPTGSPQAGDDALGPLQSAQWAASFKAQRNRVNGTIKLNGLILATFDDPAAGRACLKLRHRGQRKQNRRPTKPGRSNVTVIGGEGGSRTLRGTAKVRVILKKSGVVRLRGTVNAKQGPARGLPKQCRKLRKQAGLQPL